MLLEMVKRREKTKKEVLTLTAEIFERRYQAGDFEGKVFEEVVRAGAHATAHHNKQLLAAAMAQAAAAQGGSRVLTPRCAICHFTNFSRQCVCCAVWYKKFYSIFLNFFFCVVCSDD